jgi:mannose-1-phosphate guanylyltransferase
MEEIQKHLYVLILAGGGGTRLWPESREQNPKQFLKIFGGSSLFQQAIDRAVHLTSPDKIFISTSEKYYSLVKKEARKIPAENIIREPMRRDTALAEGVGAVYIHRRDPEAVICNFPSDHLISPLPSFVAQMKQVAKIAYETNLFATVGIVPTRPHTGMGHIRARHPFPGYPESVLLGEKFVEKPPLEVAEKYTSSGEYFWNAHLFTWKAKVFLGLLKKCVPKTYSLLPKLEAALGTEKEKQTLQLVYQMAPTLATDYAVAEKLRKFICIPAKFTWSDVGDWAEVWKHLHQDSEGNVIMSGNGRGNFVGVDARNNLFILDRQLIATVNLHDMVIVDTQDSILICPKDDAQAVKKVVQILKDKELTKYL